MVDHKHFHTVSNGAWCSQR